MFENSFGPESKLWVFQSAEEFNGEEVSRALLSFFENWQTHGRKVESASSVIEGRFLVVAVNELYHSVSGCAIDELTKAVNKVGSTKNLNLIDRGGFYIKVGNKLRYVKFTDFKDLYTQGEIVDHTEFYDASISVNREFSKKWVSRIGDSWMKSRFL